MIKNFQ